MPGGIGPHGPASAARTASRLVREEDGAAAAETAVALPAVVGLLGFCLAALGGGATQVALADAAADAARILARGDDPALAEARVASVAEGAAMSSSEGEDGLVCVDATAPLVVAGVRLDVELTASSCALGGGR